MNFSTYQSPFSWRYGSTQMRTLFSETYKYQLWRKIWIALAKAEHKAGLVSQQELQDLITHQNDIDIERILEIERETHHDVVAAIKEFSEKCKVGGGKIHFGATSMDIVDNAEMLKMKEGLTVIQQRLKTVIHGFTNQIKPMIDVPCMGYTHLQPAEPTTVGYRLAFYLQDLLTDWETLVFTLKTIKAKGMKGAVGTRASYLEISSHPLDELVMKELNEEAALIASQVYTRKYDYLVATTLASIGSSCAKFASDVRILQAPLFGEWSEPFGKKQVGSSAMPFKRNPINSEKICSLSRYVNQQPAILLENATLSHLERTLDDSANRRIIIAEIFLAIDEVLQTTEKIIKGLVFHRERIAFNLSQFGPFAASEPLLIALVKKGADRQEMHELLRTIAMKAWQEVQQGKPNAMVDLVSSDKKIKTFLTEKAIKTFLDVSNHVGDASKRVKLLLKKIPK